MKWLSSVWKTLIKIIYVSPAAGLSAVFLAGIVSWGGFNWSLELTNTESFCISCHAMREYVYKEYRKSTHYNNRTGVRASCPDCHVPKEWGHKVVRKVRATNELFHWLKGSIDTPEEFKAKRLELAQHVWKSMVATDSRECRNCHGIGFMNPDAQAAQAHVMHGLADKWGMTCIECHQGIVHSLPEGFDRDAVMDVLHDRMEMEEVNCRLCHEDIAGPPDGDGWD
jgi:cytochrome c-type protein NapC